MNPAKPKTKVLWRRRVIYKDHPAMAGGGFIIMLKILEEMNFSSDELGAIGVLMGGCSSEREISLKSGKAVSQALKNCGCKVIDLDITVSDPEEIFALIKQAHLDIAFIALHGRLGEDGTIQTILEEADIPYTGSAASASRNAFDKIQSHRIFEEQNLSIADFCVLNYLDEKKEAYVEQSLHSWPVVVKPSCEGSSIGITLVNKKEELTPALLKAFEYGHEVLVERFIKGRELTVGIIGDEPLPIVEIKPKKIFFDFEAKYQSHTTEYLVPAPLEIKLTRQIQELGLKAHQALGCRDLSRVDIIWGQDNHPYILEVNTIPGFTSTSLLPKAAKQAGLEFPDL